MNSVASTLNRVTDMEFNNQISVLTPNNWNTWKHDMQVLLMHYGCWQFIIQTMPEQPDEEATYKEKLDLQLREDVGIFISRVKTAATRLQEAGHKLDDLYIGFQLIRWLPQEFQSTVQQIYRWKEEDFRVVKIEAELILEANRLQLMKQDLEKAENAYSSSFTSKKSKTFPGATAAAYGDPNGKKEYQNRCKVQESFIQKDGGRKIKTSIGIVAYGPLWSNATESQGGNKYFLSIINDYSRKVTVFPIRNKSDIFHTFLRFQKRAERFLSKKVIAVRTDGGLEICNKDMDNFLTELGIKHKVTNSYTPEMNGVAERFNLTALDGIITLLKSSELPHKFWGEALLCFTYAWNRICHKDSNKTPFEKYSGRKPSVLHLIPFGCLAYAGVPKQIRKKFDMRAKMGIMMGYAQRTKGYRIWLIDENKLVETINRFTKLALNSNNSTSASEAKLSTFNSFDVPEPEFHGSTGNRIINFQALMGIISILCCPECYATGLKLAEDSKEGLCSNLCVACSCGFMTGFTSTPKENKKLSLNTLLVFGLRLIGR
ncbi:retrovirus-related Pol polyprotein from transposon TNT 1-94 [Trichonephila clavipes]|nr:retrovirus-related Pol polyprotein from transposon TNT 1-94 [Trichonephila clavipes]